MQALLIIHTTTIFFLRKCQLRWEKRHLKLQTLNLTVVNINLWNHSINYDSTKKNRSQDYCISNNNIINNSASALRNKNTNEKPNEIIIKVAQRERTTRLNNNAILISSLCDFCGDWRIIPRTTNFHKVDISGNLNQQCAFADAPSFQSLQRNRTVQFWDEYRNLFISWRFDGTEIDVCRLYVFLAI